MTRFLFPYLVGSVCNLNAPVLPRQASPDTRHALISAEVDTLKTTERTEDVSKEDTRMRNTIKLKTGAVARPDNRMHYTAEPELQHYCHNCQYT